jgi:hypothetical protein
MLDRSDVNRTETDIVNSFAVHEAIKVAVSNQLVAWCWCCPFFIHEQSKSQNERHFAPIEDPNLVSSESGGITEPLITACCLEVASSVRFNVNS